MNPSKKASKFESDLNKGITMAKEHLLILKSGVRHWNSWREKNPQIIPDLSLENLSGMQLQGVNFEGTILWVTDLSGANLCEANLFKAKCVMANFSNSCAVKARLDSTDFSKADLEGADFSGTGLSGSNFYGTNLKEINLKNADLRHAVFNNADLIRANFESAYLLGTIFGNTNLSGVKNIELCRHIGPSVLDYLTIEKSGTLPESFVSGCGLPDNFIETISPLIKKSRQFYKCFISYSSLDDNFVNCFQKELKTYGIKYWFAPEDMKIGGVMTSEICEAINDRDKVLLILSESSIASKWVELEVEEALKKERKLSQNVLIPIMIDQAVFKTAIGWASSLKATRNIGNFCDWNDHGSFQRAFEQLLRGLRI